MIRFRSLALLLTVLLAACGPGDGSRRSDRVLVSAAASLTDVFGAIEVAFEDANPGIDVVLNVASSSTLREQILQGAPVDVYAPADPGHMEAIVAARMSDGDPVVFAHNRMQIATPPGNSAGVSGLDDFARDELLIGLCAAGVPCGDLARQVLDAAGITASVDTDEPNVRALLAKIAAGELDAGIVYATDVVAGGVDGVDIPSAVNVTSDYPVTVVGGGSDAAEAFVEFLLSARGRSILAEYGFALP